MAKTKSDLLGATTRRYDEFQGFRFQSLTDLEWSEWESSRVDYKKGQVNTAAVKSSRRRLLCKTLVDDAGIRLFSDEEASALANVDAKLIGDLYDFAFRHCGFEDNEEEVEAERKNSEATQG